MRFSEYHSLRTRGFILTEACVSMALVGLVLGVASILLTQHARATEYFLNYRRAQLAAESCVERMRLGLIDVADGQFTDDAGVRHEIRVMDADEAWQSLRRVEVVAFVEEENASTARYSLQTYLAPPAHSGGIGP